MVGSPAESNVHPLKQERPHLRYLYIASIHDSHQPEGIESYTATVYEARVASRNSARNLCGV